MHVRCTYCRHSFNLGRDYLVDALEKMAEKKQKYHAIECPNCRKMIRVPWKQMKRYAPKPADEENEEDEASS